MLNLIISTRFISKTSGLILIIAVISTAGLVLWADVPGPKPDPNVKVVSFSPLGSTEQTVNISIKFSNALVPPDSINRMVWKLPVKFNPEIDGLARWTATDVIAFYPTKPLAPATKYTALVSAGGGYVNGNAIGRNYSFEFQTPPLSVSVSRYRAQRNRENSRKARLVIDLDFNYTVNRDELKRLLRIAGKKNATTSKLKIIWPDTSQSGSLLDANSAQFRLATELFDLREGAQQYQLIIKAGINCIECGNGLSVDYTYTMEVPQNPNLDLIIERVQQKRAGKQGTILIQFSGKVPTNEIQNYVKLEPAVPFTVDSYWRGAQLRGHFKPRSTYTVSIAAGLMSADGALLERDFSGKVTMGDLRPSIRFTSQGIYLPSDGSRLLEVKTINIDTLSIEISQVFANNLVTYIATKSKRYSWSAAPSDAFGRRTFLKDFPLEANTNEELISTIDIGKILGDTLAGIFVISARDKTSRWIADSRQVMMSDIGIMARMSEHNLLVWANSLSEAKPVRKANVKLFSRNNQLLLEGRTNSKGVATFTDIADQIEGYKPFIISVEIDGDLSFMRLDNTRLPTRDFDVSGRPYLVDAYESFMYFDRGVFRPGETANLVSVVRGENGSRLGTFPYLIKVMDPRGRLFREFRMTAGQEMAAIEIKLPFGITTGRYRAIAYLSDRYVLGQSQFLVEDFVPDRIKVTVRNDRSDYRIGDTIKTSVNGQMLFGAPASGQKVTAEIILTPQDFRPNAYSSYKFKVPGRDASVSKIKLGESKLPKSGIIEFIYIISDKHRPPGLLTARVWATVSETGGRAVSSFSEAKIHPYKKYVGIKTNLEGYAKVGESVQTRIVLVQPDGQPTMGDSIQLSFFRVVYNSMLQKQPDGSYRFVSERTTEPIESKWQAIGIDGNTVQFTPRDYGHYEIVASDPAGGHSAGVKFYAAGWGRVPWSLSEPDRLQLDLDRTEYSPGMNAMLLVRAPFAGKLLITIENQTIQDYLTFDLTENTGEIAIHVERGYSPNVYITATLIRPAVEISKHTPARAFGIVPLKVIQDERRLDVTVQSPQEIKPNSKLNIRVSTNGSRDAKLTIAAVDVGILQLTDFNTPDPFGFFYGKRRPSMAGYDLYSLIYPETERAGSHLSPSGGFSSLRETRHQNPFQARRVNAVSLWSGVVAVDSAGNAEIDFEVPQFNGQLTIMAVAADGDRFGSASASLLVKEPIILQESFPRFVAPNDKVQGIVTVFNGLDTAANISVKVEIAGQAKLESAEPKLISLKSQEQGVVIFPFEALPAPGIIEIKLETQAGAETSRVSFEMANRPAVPLTTKFGSGQVTADSLVRITLPADWVTGTEEYILRTSSLAAMQLTQNIEYLLRYPYGCLEQTTSALFPLLYFDDLVKIVRPELFGGKGHEYFVAEGIDKLLRHQQSSGAFVYWPGSNRIHNWSSIYASHFLVEAKQAGYDIDNSSYKRTIRFLVNIARDKGFADVSNEQRVYACYILTKVGKLDNRLFNYLSGLNVSKLPLYTVYQLAASMAMAGDVARAKEMIPFDIQLDFTAPQSGGNFSSGVRTNAILLDLLLSIDAENPSAAVLARSLLQGARLNQWYNTQATAFALMSLGKFFSHTEPADFKGYIQIDGQEKIQFGTEDFSYSSNDIGGKELTIAIEGKGTCFYYWQASGVPQSGAIPEFDRGIVVRREYLEESGSQVNLSNVELGSRIIGHIFIETTEESLNNVVIADLLPAGFEIENPRLEGKNLMPEFRAKQSKLEHQDIRDDRILLFINIRGRKTQHYYYSIRVIARGDFIVPPVAAECMYNPLKASAASSGRVVIVDMK